MPMFINKLRRDKEYNDTIKKMAEYSNPLIKYNKETTGKESRNKFGKLIKKEMKILGIKAPRANAKKKTADTK